jgi:hypothetical protein
MKQHREGCGERRVASWWVLLVASAALGLTACHPGTYEDVTETDLVATGYDKTADFGNYSTYAMPDSVVDISELAQGQPKAEDGIENEELILDAIATNLSERGYVRVEPDANPDLAVVAFAYVSTTVGIWYPYPWDPYWGWWPCCYPPGWGWYPPYYGGSYSYDTGTLVIGMAKTDLTGAPEGKIPVIWTAALNGILSSSTSQTGRRIQNGIDQAFVQSPYLKAAR